ncbi:LysR substrate-binding domain-containing protein [Defluviimonas sp. WL0024]|uniref:LysR substrate-binding domain-containing protein n=1 Tax=Albidovulum salinarum TaxID=2984153 RepID=A0ABT2X1W8_9RHOB|nr:LysR substrate-binding domain-containing protein [Defluviimonas sp. WL0024]MCU9847932.1 LysR substrate-binding domain-containing protein [Defluviimonas sp. WL0024]
MKRYTMPSLSLFHTFEVVARRKSFTLAADELCLTQSAVSRQIKALEEQLGVALFRRLHRAIEPTAEGRRLFESVTRGLQEIETCVTGLRAATVNPQITVAASVAFSYFWLMPRLERFSARHPEIDLRILATDQRVDLRQEGVDVAILYGVGQWEGARTHLLFGERVYPVCSPEYLRSHPELRAPSDMLDQTLLHLDGGGNIWGGVDWRVWLATQGATGQPVRRGVRLNSYPMIIQAAEAGRGVALGWSYITDPMLAEGRLVRPVDKVLETREGYYVGALEKDADVPAIASFLQWIRGEVAENSPHA